MADKVKITLTGSLIACKPKQRRTAHALGLRKISASTIRNNDKVTAGMISTIRHLVKVEEVR
jgi:large subunit ribosomal protein L30